MLDCLPQGVSWALTRDRAERFPAQPSRVLLRAGQCDNDYPLHYTFSSSSMRLYAQRLISTIMTAMTNTAIKPAPTMIGLVVA
jgi:hypothetical protein